MPRSESLSFRFSLPEKPAGELVELTPAQTERLLLDRLAAERDNPVEAMWQLGTFYKQDGRVDRAMECFLQLFSRVDDLETKADCVLSLGQTAERMNDFELAVNFYRQGLALEPTSTFTWYFIANNIGYSLSQLGRFVEGEDYCRRAITINPQRPNAYKNLGLALQGQGRFREAAEAYVAATQADASDPRALGLLRKLLEEQPALLFDFEGMLESCEKAVGVAADQWRERQPVVERGVRAKFIYWWFRLRNLWKRIRG